MRRGLLGVLALLAATFASPVHAAPSKTVVYEVVRRPDAAKEGRVRVWHLPGNGPSVVMSALLVPYEGSYGWRGASGSTDDGGGDPGWSATMTLTNGARFIVGGDRGRVGVQTLTRGWSVREIGSGFRYVAADEGATSLAGADVVNGTVSAPAGPYGSMAFAAVPCEPGAGRWTLRSDAGEENEFLCQPLAFADNVLDTRRGRSWSVDAQVAGVRRFSVRLAVLDYPKAPRR